MYRQWDHISASLYQDSGFLCNGKRVAGGFGDLFAGQVFYEAVAVWVLGLE